MTRDEALHTLTYSSSHQRLRAARFLARNTHPDDLHTLKRARQSETVSYVKKSLDIAIARISNNPTILPSDPADELNVPDHVRRHIMTQVVERVSRLLLHEIASPLGLVRQTASREVSNYEDSKTKQHLDRLKRICEGIEYLTKSATSCNPEEFDLSHLIAQIVDDETVSTQLVVSKYGPTPMLITSDSGLLQLAICNGLRNAIEAVAESGSNESHPIIITWGITDVDYWITVIDKGPGLVGPIESAFEIGASTKQGHSGFGLAISRQAMQTLGGTVTLQPAAGGGTRYELRWEI